MISKIKWFFIKLFGKKSVGVDVTKEMITTSVCYKVGDKVYVEKIEYKENKLFSVKETTKFAKDLYNKHKCKNIFCDNDFVCFEGVKVICSKKSKISEVDANKETQESYNSLVRNSK